MKTTTKDFTTNYPVEHFAQKFAQDETMISTTFNIEGVSIIICRSAVNGKTSSAHPFAERIAKAVAFGRATSMSEIRID